jgi:hypothetical protein
VLRRFGLALVLGIALVACSNAAPSAMPTASVNPSDAASPTEPSTPTPNVTPTAAGCPTEQLCSGPVSEDQVTFRVGSRTVRFVPGPGWTASVGAPGVGFQLIRHGVDTEGFSVNSFAGVVFDDACSESPDPASAPATPDGLVAFLETRQGIAVTDGPASIAVGGLDGMQVDVAVVAPAACPDVSAMSLWRSGKSSVQELKVGQEARVIVVPDGDQAIVMVFESFSHDGFQELLDTEFDMLQTVSFE